MNNCKRDVRKMDEIGLDEDMGDNRDIMKLHYDIRNIESNGDKVGQYPEFGVLNRFRL